MNRYEQTEDYQRALLLRRWIESLHSVLPTRTRGMLLRSISQITRTSAWFHTTPEQAPLAGLDPCGFIEELHRPEGGAVLGVKGVGPTTIEELRQALPSPGSPTIPRYMPPPNHPAGNSLLSHDPAVALLNDLWASLESRERLRLVELAADLVIDRCQQEPALESAKDRELAEAIKHRLREACPANTESVVTE
jgi:hypothetical protein